MTGKAGAALPRIALIGFGAIADDVVRCLEVRGEIASLEGAMALAGRHIEAHGAVPVAYKSLVDAKKLRILAVGADARSPLYGDAPTFRENGVDLTIGAFHGVFAPNGTPTAIVDKVADALQAALGSRELNERMNDVGAAIVFLRGAEAQGYLENQDKAYRAIIDALGLRVAKSP